MRNKRLIYFIATIIIICLGLASRKFGAMLPTFIAEYSGDALWAAMVYLGLRFLFPSLRMPTTALVALLFSYFIEITQLYQADWINSIRNTTVGALILGHGFLWTDLVCYTVGVILVFIIDRLFFVSR
ncbi:DUF2809 domain-containing protein [Bacteroides sp. 519]|uniref:ribosomal maturation YjgA family protein n=1 Tax=Bacteroides sp. 519 TaxID=2302937 RepID=UPI0013D5F83B|nr:DUF2809 domain-containing protein [Bacteroides sp. 519]NDV59807.1 DUF2809 domain-containing protein [Bacteroides sp. 519]